MRGSWLAIGIAFMLSAIVDGASASTVDEAARKGQELIRALRNGDDLGATALIGSRTDVNARDPTGVTPLMWAAQSGYKDIVRCLLQAGAKPNLTSENGLGALQIAIGNHDTDMALLLLAHGADPNSRRADGETALMTAARTGQLELMRQLIARGAHVNAHENRFEQTALMWSAGQPEQMKLLIQHGADLKAKTRSWTITHTVYKSAIASAEGLEDDGVYVNRQGGQSALFFAVQKNDLESVKLLLEAGAAVDDRAADGSTPLILALCKWDTVPATSFTSELTPGFAPNLKIANFLLDRGASAKATNSIGYTPLHGAVLALIPEAPTWILPGIRPPPPHNNVPVNPEEGMALIRRLLDLQANPNAVIRYPLSGPVAVVHLDPTVKGSSPLHIAAYAHNTALVTVLLDRGADPDLLRPDGHTPLSLATKANDLPTVQALVAHGADPQRLYDPTDMIDDFIKSAAPGTAVSRSPRHHQTLLHIAAAAGAANVVAFLAERGVSLSAQNDRGETALMMADTQEERRYSLQKNPGGLRTANPNAVRSTMTSDAIRKAMGIKPVAAATAAPPAS